MMRALLLPMLLMHLIAGPASAEPTPLVVRVISQGAKFVGTGMDGVHITVRDAGSGKTLAQGLALGGTGDTARIMNGRPRGTPIADDSAAAFRATLDVTEPTLVDVQVHGPVQPAGAAVAASAQHWLIPGAAVLGDGWVIELPGLAVSASASASKSAANNRRRVTAHVSMMCGCPITPGGMWDAARFKVEAWVVGAAVGSAGMGNRRVPLAYAGTTGDFAGDLPSGAAVIVAQDSLTGATGTARIAVPD
ncbi:hypothetical protein [Sandarakinorhabdus sp.]|uniref:hypothetical protein n=1 Tax=Sandarakinorhabdus sp. TaxID=1916663 RepID=UPI00286E7AB8|nr:hypothetical protein [Sandarakinorhabdus sp.]